MRHVTAFVVWIILLLAPCAQAVPILTLVPQGSVVLPGGRLYVDLMLSGLEDDEVLGGFSLDLAFSPSLRLFPFGAGGTRFGPYLGNVAMGEALGGADIGTDSASMYEFSLLSSAQLADLQDSSFRLATLQFYLPVDAVIPDARLFDIGITRFLLADGAGDLLPGEAGPPITIAVPEPHPMALFPLALAMLVVVGKRRRRWPLALVLIGLGGAAAAQTVKPPLPPGPLKLTIQSTSDVKQSYYITQGIIAPEDASLIPLAVNQSTEHRVARFSIVSAQVVTITFSSDDGGNFDYNFEFTPGLYRLEMSYVSPLPWWETDYAVLTIQKAAGGRYETLAQVSKDADTYVHAFFRSGPDKASGILQTVIDKETVGVYRQITIPDGSATFTNKSGLWPHPVICPTPKTCASMRRTVTVEGDGSIELYSPDALTGVTKSLFPTRYDQLDFSSNGFELSVVHRRVPFIPPGPPTIGQLPDQAPLVPQDAPRSLTLYGIGDGTPDEIQGISVSATSSNPAIVTTPVVTYQPGDNRAVLTYRPGGGIGKASITVTVRDDGGTPGYPGDDSSSTITFGVSVIDGKPCDGRACFAYVSERDRDLIDVIDVETGAVAGNFQGGDALALSPDGRRLYTLLGSNVLVIDTSTRRQIASIAVPEPSGQIALSPSGNELVVSAPTQLLAGTDRLVVINTATNKITHTIDLANRPYPQAMAFSPDGSRLYVTSTAPDRPGQLIVVDMVAHAVTSVTPLDAGPHKIAVSPNGERVYVSSVDSDSLAVLDRDGVAVARIAVGDRPQGVAVAPDGRLAYVGVFNGAFQGDLAVIDTRTNKIVNRIPFEGLNVPKELAFTPDGTRLYVSFEADRSVALVAPATGRVVTRIPIGTPTLALALTAMPLPPRVLGDVVRDNAVDRRDVDLLRADLGKTVGEAVCGIACDLDADGSITVLDARRMATLCTTANCAPAPAKAAPRK